MQVKEILRVKGNRLLTIEPSGRASDAARTMSEQNLGSLVVFDQGRMVGMLTFREILQAFAEFPERFGSLEDARSSASDSSPGITPSITIPGSAI